MPDRPVQSWLRAEAAREAIGSLLFALVCSVMGIAALAVTAVGLLGVTWVLVTVATSLAGGRVGMAFGFPAVSIAILPALGLAGLFAVNARLARADLEAWHRRESRRAGEGSRRRGVGALDSLLAYPGYELSRGWGWVLMGPRLTHLAWAHATRARRLRRLDLASAERVILALLAKGKRLPLAELAIHAGLEDPVRSLLALRDLPGMIFLAEPPPALTLSGEYRMALGAVAGPLPSLRDVTEETERAAAAVRSLQTLLGLGSPGPSRRPETTERPEPRKLRLVSQSGAALEAATRDQRRGTESIAGASKAVSGRAEPAPDARRIWERHKPPRRT